MLRPVLVGLFLAILLISGATGRAAFVYDFPGTPGSGLVANQTVPPGDGNAMFSDWTRVNVSAVGTANVFDSNFWNNTSFFDSTQYESFTITANAGWHLNLQSLTFDEMATAGGPTKGRVYLFLNGSAVPYSGLDYNPDPSVTNRTFGFTPTVDADNVTTAEFRFYGWNGGTPNASLILDNVTLTVAIVPEPAMGALVACLVALAVLHARRSGYKRRTKYS